MVGARRQRVHLREQNLKRQRLSNVVTRSELAAVVRAPAPDVLGSTPYGAAMRTAGGDGGRVGETDLACLIAIARRTVAELAKACLSPAGQRGREQRAAVVVTGGDRARYWRAAAELHRRGTGLRCVH